MTAPKVHRPYSTGKIPSVTTILGVLSKDGLQWAAAKETAMFAVNHRDEWETLSDFDAVERLRKHHQGVWDHRAALGTMCHAVNEAWARGETFDLEDAVVALQTGSHVWAKYPTEQLMDELDVMVDGLERAWNELTPATVAVEDVVRYTDAEGSYVGSSDWQVRIWGKSFLVDLKTTGRTEPGSALYWDSWRLQLAAYRYASEIVDYDGRTEVGTRPLLPVDDTAILHLRMNGEWGFHPVKAGREEHGRFLDLCRAYRWRLRASKDSGVPQSTGGQQ
ncbi:MAG: hypothetical protein ACRDYC_05540 [Acidimicrobiales bacterium]